MTPPVRPPRMWERFASLLLSRDDRADALGDLHEEYRIVAERRGPKAAKRWYRAQLFHSVGPWLRRVRPRLGRGGTGADLRLALRSLRRNPTRALIVIAILALGIGSSTMIFSVVDQVVLRPLPYPGSDRIHSVWNVYPDWRDDDVLGSYWDRVTVSWPEFLDMRQSELLEEVAAASFFEVVLEEPGDPTRLSVGFASANFFRFLGVQPHLGRIFLDGEEGIDAPSIALVTHGFWVDRLGSDPRVVGTTLRLQGRAFEVVGVLPEGFRWRGMSSFGPLSHDQEIWLPIGTFGLIDSRGNRSFEAVARTVPNVLPSFIEEDLTDRVWGEGDASSPRIRLASRHAEEVEDARAPLFVLFGSAALLMLIVGANVTTLRIGSVAAREREWATRSALGAGRGRLSRQLLVESVTLGAIGIALGGVAAAVALRSWVDAAPAALLLGVDVELDGRALLFAGTIGLLISVAAAWIPLTRIRERSLRSSVARGGGYAGRGAGFLQRGLLVSQVALSLVLLSAAALFLRSLERMNAVDPGFRSEGIVTMEVAPSARRFGSAEEVVQFHARVAERIRSLPGVRNVSATSIAPFDGGIGSNSFGIESRPIQDGERTPEGLRRNVRPGFFELLDVPLLEGRELSVSDGASDPLVAVVSASMAEAYWPGRSPVGDAILRSDRRIEIVGVVGDVTRADLTAEPEPTFYVPFAQEPVPALDVLVQVDAFTPTLAESLRQAVWAEDPTLPIPALDLLSDRVRRSMFAERFRSLLAGFFALTAALLVALGLFGVAVQGVLRRTKEIGVRMALGATSSGVSGMVIRRELHVVWVGMAIGLGVVLLGGRVLAGALFGVEPTDLPSLLAATTGLVVVATIAVWIPARRAARMDPVEVLGEG